MSGVTPGGAGIPVCKEVECECELLIHSSEHRIILCQLCHTWVLSIHHVVIRVAIILEEGGSLHARFFD